MGGASKTEPIPYCPAAFLLGSTSQVSLFSVQLLIKKRKSNNNTRSSRPPPSPTTPSLPRRRRTTATSDGVFDAPHAALHKFSAETRAIVSAVSPKWRVGVIGEKTLALLVPHDQEVLGVSKKNFVDLLEFAEDKLEMERVLAVFEKARVVPTEGFPRTLRYVGFRPYALDEHPVELPSERYFIMSYKV
ncbi:unnamed protein product [Caenorhabditis sp. 36 PRJEB53466]|nr:unnamed protein product [Caenorhabditis sp. 36 PRJEB53466]